MARRGVLGGLLALAALVAGPTLACQAPGADFDASCVGPDCAGAPAAGHAQAQAQPHIAVEAVAPRSYQSAAQPGVEVPAELLAREAAFVAEAEKLGIFHYGRPGPIFDPALFPKLKIFQDHWEAIRDEALSVKHDMNLRRTHPSFEHPSTIEFVRRVHEAGNNGWTHAWAKDGGWTNYALVMHDQTIPGVTEQLCPLTTALIKQVPGMRLGGFSRLKPHSAIETHTDHTGLGHGSISFHLYLTGYARMRVEDEWFEMIPGNMFMFDSNVPHEVINGDEDRIILYIDIDIANHYRNNMGIDMSPSSQVYFYGRDNWNSE